MTRDELAAMTKAELVELARRKHLSGRSRMTKPELVDALAGPQEPLPIPGIGRDDRIEAARRRRALADRLTRLVDRSQRCDWRSTEGHPCGLPCVVDEDRCALHRKGGSYDAAIPVTGSLGFDAWPQLLRHLTLATYDVDPVGLDPIVHEMAWHLANGLYFDYFRVEVDGIEHVPDHGAAMLVANHGGAALPYDGAMLSLAVLNEMERPRRLRITGTEIFNMLPWLSHMYRKVGGAYAARADAAHLLSTGALVGVFPEGERGFMKPVWQAYQVQRLGRGGFGDVAEQAGVPIVPVAIVGAEEVHPAVTVSSRLASLVKMVFPQQRVEEIAVFLNPFPLPVRWRIRFLPPIRPEAPGSVPDPLAVLERAEQVRQQIQAALEELLAERRTAF